MIAAGAARVANILAGDSVVGNVLAFKLLNEAFYAGSVALVASILGRVDPGRALAGTLLLAWNPVVLYETAGNGHNDIAMIFFILAACRLLIGRRYGLSILALVAGGLIKFIPVLLIPAAGLIALRDLPNARSRARFLAVTTVAGLALSALAYAPFWHGIQVLGITRREHLYTTSLPATAVAYLQGDWGADRAAQAISKVSLGWTLIFALDMGFRALWDRGWDSFVRSAFYILMFYLLVTVPWFQNWYALWPLALAVLLPSGHASRLGQIFAFATLSKQFIVGPMVLWQMPLPDQVWRELRLGPGVLAIPWAYALYVMGDSLLRPVLLPKQRLAPVFRVPSRSAAAPRPCDRPDCM
jgi:hypothetical protein